MELEIFVPASAIISFVSKVFKRIFTAWAYDMNINSFTLPCDDLAFKENGAVRAAANDFF